MNSPNIDEVNAIVLAVLDVLANWDPGRRTAIDYRLRYVFDAKDEVPQELEVTFWRNGTFVSALDVPLLNYGLPGSPDPTMCSKYLREELGLLESQYSPS